MIWSGGACIRSPVCAEHVCRVFAKLDPTLSWPATRESWPSKHAGVLPIIARVRAMPFPEVPTIAAVHLPIDYGCVCREYGRQLETEGGATAFSASVTLGCCQGPSDGAAGWSAKRLRKKLATIRPLIGLRTGGSVLQGRRSGRRTLTIVHRSHPAAGALAPSSVRRIGGHGPAGDAYGLLR